MRIRATRVLAVTGVLMACAACATPDPAGDRQADREQIVAALNAWPDAWAGRDAEGVCDLFAPEAVLTFPGGPDRTGEQACAQFTALVGASDKTVRYQRPEISEVVVDGDLAAVRLIWTGEITGADGTVLERTREQGLDVLRRQQDGTWRITISHAFAL